MTAVTPAAAMARALQLAQRGCLTTFPNPRVGCVIVKDGVIVGEGWHERAGEPHAEVFALRAAGERARGADLYVTQEPCSHYGRTPPCSDAVIAAAPARVIVGLADPNPLVAGGGIAAIKAAGIPVETGLMAAAVRALNRGYLSRMERGRPWLTLKLAASLDGRTATARGESQWITGEPARADVHALRAAAGAVMTSSLTVLTDDPQLTVRGAQAPARQPDRIVLDSQARVRVGARVWAPGARRFWLVGCEPAAVADGVEMVVVPPNAAGRLDLNAALQALGRLGVNELLVECGPMLAGALLQARLVDELLLYLAPSLIGDDGRGLARLAGLAQLDQRLRLRYTDVRAVGRDLKITAIPEEG